MLENRYLPAVFAGVRLICIHLYLASLATMFNGFSSKLVIVDCSCWRYWGWFPGGWIGAWNDEDDDVDDDEVSLFDNGTDE